MSHVTPITIQEKWDLKTARTMCEDMGWQLMEGQTTYKWYGQFMGDYPLPKGFTVADLGKCDHAIRVPGASYEIGIATNPKTGETQLLWDFWSSGGLQAKLGKDAGVLKQAYGMAKAKQTCIGNRFVKRFYERPAPDGKRKLVIEV